jgi:hypothetical protein
LEISAWLWLWFSFRKCSRSVIFEWGRLSFVGSLGFLLSDHFFFSFSFSVKCVMVHGGGGSE